MATKRRKAFLRALATTGQSQAAWAKDAGISPAHLSLVLNGKRDSITLTERIDAFVTEQLNEKTALTRTASAA